MKRPKPIRSITSIDVILGISTLSVLAASFLLAIYSYNELPEIIPTHFTFNGVPDKFGNKYSIWFLPAIAFFLSVGLWVLGRFPQYFNYIIEINQENAQRQYRLATTLVRVLACLVSLIFLFATYETILSAENKIHLSGSWHFLFTTISFLIVLVVYLLKSNKTS